jgi:hypothetical protein
MLPDGSEKSLRGVAKKRGMRTRKVLHRLRELWTA